MKFFIYTLISIVMVVAGFVLGVDYQQHLESLDQVQSLVQVQRAKIDELRVEKLQLHTGIMLRDYLSEVRVRLPQETMQDMSESITNASVKFDVPPEMILAIIRIESTFDTAAVSNKGAIGLMQLMPATARQVAEELRIDWPGVEILEHPATNIEMGTYYFTKLLARFENMAVALAAYNHGPTRISNLEQAEAELPMGYSRKVLRHYNP
ncbi:MAG: lytic transglycosylase domain-containing protein [Acidobacteriota bacterium]